MNKKIVLIVASIIALAGCKQDPLAEYPKEVRGATPGKTEPEREEKIVRDSLFIEASEFFKANEGDTIEEVIKGRVLIENMPAELNVENLHDFKGATFDPATGIFKWKVPDDVVRNAMTEILTLKVSLTTLDKPVVAQFKEIPVYITRNLASPKIINVTGLNPAQPFREGNTYYFEVTVRSPEEMTKPVMSVVMNRVGLENGSGFVSLRRDIDNPLQNTSDPSLWTFYLQMNLSDADVTNRLTDLYFGLQAYSSFGMPSAVHNVSVKVITSWMEPKVSWVGEVVFTEGRENTYSFTLLDPRDEGRVEGQFGNCTSLGANCSCTTVTTSIASCTITWTPEAKHVNKSYEVKFTGFNRSTVSTDNTFTRKDFTGLRVKVVPAPVPPPSPSPTPVAMIQGGN